MAPSLLELFFIFFYIGLFTIGGGLVAITLMEQLLVDKGYLSHELFVNMIAISESTPGPVGVNMATYIGNEYYGVFGGIVATLGEILPSLICIILIAKLFSKFSENKLVKNTLVTLRPATCALILVACVGVFKVAILDFSGATSDAIADSVLFGFIKIKEVIFYLASLVLLFLPKLNSIYVILIGALFGILFL